MNQVVSDVNLVTRWLGVLLLAALCGCSSVAHYTSSLPGTTAASAPATGPIPTGQCTTDDGLVASQFQIWQQTGYEWPSMAGGLFADYAMAAVGGDSHEPGAVDEADAVALQSAWQAFDQQAPGYSPAPFDTSPTSGASYGRDLGTVEADAAWWAACS